MTSDYLTAIEQSYMKENVELKKQVVKIEEYSRRKNLLVHGIQERENERCKDVVLSIMENKLGIANASTRIVIDKAHRVGPRRAQTCRPIIVQFIYSDHLSEVYSKWFQLRDQGKNSRSSMFLTRDYPEEMVRIRRQLKYVLKVAKKTDSTAYLLKDKLIYNGKALSLADCYEVKEFNVEQIGYISKANSVLFHGRFCPLSNFYPCNFEVNGKRFNSTEQFYQYQKAVYSGRWSLSHKILFTSDPVDIKKLGDTLDRDRWPAELQITTMKKGLHAKFTQNWQIF